MSLSLQKQDPICGINAVCSFLLAVLATAPQGVMHLQAKFTGHSEEMNTDSTGL